MEPGDDHVAGPDLRVLAARRATEAGLLVAAAAMPETFQRTLMPRSNLDQALVSGLTFTLAHGLVSTLQEVVQWVAGNGDQEESAADARAWSRRAIAADAGALASGWLMHHLLTQADDERLWRASGRTSGLLVAVTGLAGAVTGLVHEVAAATADDGDGAARRARLGLVVAAGAMAGSREFGRRRREAALDTDPPGDGDEARSAARSLGLGVAVAAGAAGIARAEGAVSDRIARGLARVLPGSAATWRPVGHAAALGMAAAAGRAGAQQVFHRIEGMNTGFEAALDVAPWRPEVSGSPASVVPFASMSRMGRRMVWTIRPPEEIERVMEEPAVAHPVRTYVGLESAPTAQERVQLALDDLERAGGLDRSWLLLASPTGTGYVNYAALGALEFLTRGDCASLALQYGARPSPLSLDRVEEGRLQFRLLVDALADRLRDRARRPTVVVFGESLGAWTSQDAFMHLGTDGLLAVDIEHAVWIGTPFGSKWKDQVLGAPRPDVDRELVGVFNDISEWEALDPGRAADLRFVMITHHDDAVAWFGQDLLVQRPAWLGDPATRPTSVPPSQRWVPITTFVQTLVDMKNAAQVVPGVFDAKGHDYRADLAPFLSAVLSLPATPLQQQRIRQALEAEEAVRTRWIREHGRVGSSMASELVERIRRDHPEAFTAAMDSLRTDLRGWQQEWDARGETD